MSTTYVAETSEDAESEQTVMTPEAGPDDSETTPRRVPRIGIWSWTFVGFVIVMVIIVIVLSALSEIVLPMTFAAVLAVIFKPLVGILERHKWKPTLAAGVVVLGLLALMAGVMVATVRGVTAQLDEVGTVTDAAIENLSDQVDALGVDQASLEAARAGIEQASPVVSDGVVTKIVEGVGSIIGLASGIILGSLIMYYLLKDGTTLRRNAVSRLKPQSRDEIDGFIGDACRILRDDGGGRTVMSAIVSVVIGVAALLLGLPLVFTIMVVNFVGGYIPYIGAFLGGGLAVIVALGDGGLPDAVIMLVIVLASNLLLENFVEPKVMGRSLDLHPVIVLIVTALGGLVGGIVGLILAVPFYVIARSAISRLRTGGVVDRVADKAQPTVQRLLQ